MRQVNGLEENLNEFLAEFSLHEIVGGDLAGVATLFAVFVGSNCQMEDLFHERHGQRILHVASAKSSAIPLIELLILRSDVGWVCHYGVILPTTQHPFKNWQVFALIGVLAFCVATGQFEVKNTMTCLERRVQQ